MGTQWEKRWTTGSVIYTPVWVSCLKLLYNTGAQLGPCDDLEACARGAEAGLEREGTYVMQTVD